MTDSARAIVDKNLRALFKIAEWRSESFNAVRNQKLKHLELEKPINRVENLDYVKFEHNTTKVVIMNESNNTWTGQTEIVVYAVMNAHRLALTTLTRHGARWRASIMGVFTSRSTLGTHLGQAPMPCLWSDAHVWMWLPARTVWLSSLSLHCIWKPDPCWTGYGGVR